MSDAAGAARSVEGWLDTHCHIQPPYSPEGIDPPEVLKEAGDSGVSGLVCVGTDASTSSSALELVSGLRAMQPGFGLWATVGLHPHEASRGTDEVEELLARAVAELPGIVVAVGECGLDYHYDHSPRDVQRSAFARQIALAKEHGLALVVHARDAWDDILDLLCTEGAPERIVMHCFTGGKEEARRCLDLGAHLSFSGIVTFKGAEDVREAAGITRIVVPEHMYADERYDKWGNVLLASGQRTRGELFFDESVQKVLAEGGVLDLFTSRVKFPRTHHVPWSPGVHSDDRVLGSLRAFEGRRVVVTRKMDGENTTLYRDYTHARSVDSRTHPSRSWVKQFWSSFAHDIPRDWRVCGENLFARHSLAYKGLASFFLGFSVWNERNVCLSWDETLEWFELLGVTPVPVLYDGIFERKAVEALWDKDDASSHEGYVMRVADAFTLSEYRTHVGKFVREGHVQTAKHWMRGQRIVPNELAA